MNTQMQPAIKMALRVARQGSDYLKAHFERQEPNGDSEDRRRQLERVEQSIYDNFSEQLDKAYKDHAIAPLNEADADGNDKSWHIFPVLGRENFLRDRWVTWGSGSMDVGDGRHAALARPM